ncbi:hypothetical protein [Baaleninema sp.]|uniref:hypothetical protein n=1 Tax=Baaleninema sp. TaxID=3101197 RepID=UPI003D043BF8
MAILLAVALTIVGWLLFVFSIDVPLAIFNALHLPRWLAIALLVAVVSWCFGD